MSPTPFVSFGTRFVAWDRNATLRPSADRLGNCDDAELGNDPSTDLLIHSTDGPPPLASASRAGGRPNAPTTNRHAASKVRASTPMRRPGHPPRLRPVTTSPPGTLIPSDRDAASHRGAANHAIPRR